MLKKIKLLKARSRLRKDFEAILSTPEGERVFRWMMRECHITRPTFQKDDNLLRECEGRRRLGMSILTLLGRTDPDQLINLIEQEEQHHDTHNERNFE